MAKAAKKGKRWGKRGRDWHGWAFWHPEIKEELGGDGFCLWAEAGKKPTRNPMGKGGEWVRVKFAKVM